MTIENKTFLITGATSGLGRTLTIQLAEQGYNLAICGRSEDKMNDLIKTLNLPSTKLFYQCFSVTNEEQVKNFVNRAQDHFGHIDILINNAGANTERGTIEVIKTSDLDYMYSLNFKAPFIFMREVYQGMKKRKKGMIVNILSTVCLYSNEGIGAYTATKSGLDALTKVFRKEARHNNIKVCSIYPGGINTQFRTTERPDYMSANSVAKTIISTFVIPTDVVIDELVIRPIVETNFS